MRRPEVLVVGSGPHALTAAAYLLTVDPWLSGRLAVADPRPWLASWHGHFTRLQLDRLRSACVHHPDPRPYALLDVATAAGREGELHGPAGSPSTALFADFCHELVARHDLEAARLPATVTALHPRDDGDVDVRLGADRLRARRVVLASNPVRPCAPALAARHSDTVCLDEVRAGQRVVVVGGALTAAHLALRASERGAQVHLVARAPLREQAMDVDAVWLGHALPAFAGDSPEQRASQVREARRGTVPPEVLHRLQAEPRVAVHIGQVGCAGAEGVRLHDGRRVPGEHVWLATGHVLDVRADPLTAGLLEQVPVRVVDGLPVLTDELSWAGTGVHLTGGLAALGVGPAARKLAGARMAAERCTPAVTGIEVRRRQYPVGVATSNGA
jgi:cation diffusion facilitator CzcD-associated flavoprotein CzcO